MKIKFSLLIIITSFYCFGQDKLTLGELIKLNYYNLDQFDTYVTQKGFKYNERKEDEYSEDVIYSYSLNGYADRARCFITKTSYKLSKFREISYQLFNQETYLILKRDLIKLGFKFNKTIPTENGTSFEYKKGKLELTLETFRAENQYEKIDTLYKISLSEYPK